MVIIAVLVHILRNVLRDPFQLVEDGPLFAKDGMRALWIVIPPWEIFLLLLTF